jgi:hypothetical protein
METSKSRRRARSNAKPAAALSRTGSAGTSRKAGASRVAAAWITDPGALLEALASAERDAKEALARAQTEASELRSREAEEAEAEALSAAEVHEDLQASKPANALAALPTLREDERIGRRSGEGVVVIIRRRRAA